MILTLSLQSISMLQTETDCILSKCSLGWFGNVYITIPKNKQHTPSYLSLYDHSIASQISTLSSKQEGQKVYTSHRKIYIQHKGQVQICSTQDQEWVKVRFKAHRIRRCKKKDQGQVWVRNTAHKIRSGSFFQVYSLQNICITKNKGLGLQM